MDPCDTLYYSTHKPTINTSAPARAATRERLHHCGTYFDFAESHFFPACGVCAANAMHISEQRRPRMMDTGLCWRDLPPAPPLHILIAGEQQRPRMTDPGLCWEPPKPPLLLWGGMEGEWDSRGALAGWESTGGRPRGRLGSDGGAFVFLLMPLFLTPL